MWYSSHTDSDEVIIQLWLVRWNGKEHNLEYQKYKILIMTKTAQWAVLVIIYGVHNKCANDDTIYESISGSCTEI